MTAGREDAVVTSLVLSYPADLSGHGRDRIDQDHFRRYLKLAHGTAVEGDRWEEFTDIGCCGNQRAVRFVVKSVAEGTRVTEDTTIEFVEREACDQRGGWAVQGDEPDPV